MGADPTREAEGVAVGACVELQRIVRDPRVLKIRLDLVRRAAAGAREDDDRVVGERLREDLGRELLGGGGLERGGVECAGEGEPERVGDGVLVGARSWRSSTNSRRRRPTRPSCCAKGTRR